MGDHPRDVLTYGFCGVLVTLYAATRFNTPASNRASTIRLWYWQGLASYVAACLALFGVLSIILEQPALRDLLLKYAMPSDPPQQVETIMLVPPALAATLIMTVLLPSVPYIKRLDDALLGFFLRMACIPAEVLRRAKILNHGNLRLTASDLLEIESFVRDAPIPNEALDHVRATAETQWEDSELRFTKLLLAFRRLDALQEQPRYGNFFAENSQEYKTFRDGMLEFFTRSAKGLAQATRLRALESKEEYEDLIREKREAFKAACLDRFDALAQFLARAVLQSELSERDVQDRLRKFGFDAVAVDRVVVPIHQLATVAVIILVYLIASRTFLVVPVDAARAAATKWVPFLVALTHLATIGFTLWFIQAFAWARRNAGGQRPVASYMLCGVLSAGITALLWAGFDVARSGTLPDLPWLASLLPFLVNGGLLCMFVAYTCDDIPPAVPEPWWFRGVEAAGCCLAVGLAAATVQHLLAQPGHAPEMTTLLFPAGVAFVVGFYVPTLYRTQCRLRTAQSQGMPGEADAVGAGAVLAG